MEGAVECQREKRTTGGKGNSRDEGRRGKKIAKEGKRGASGESENPVAVFRGG